MTDAEVLPRGANEAVPPLFLFRLADTLLLCPAASVEAVTSFEEPVPLPRVPRHVQGLVTYDQRALVLVDLALFLGLDASAAVPRQRTLVVSAGGYRVGLPVDAAVGVVDLASTALRHDGNVYSGRLAELAQAEVETSEGLAALLDLDALLEAARA